MKLLLLLISVVASFASCKKDQLTTYNVEDNVYFNYSSGRNVYTDTLDFSFAYSKADVMDTIVNLPVAVTGVPVGYDRSFRLVVDPTSTAVAGTHYVLPNAVIRAGRVFDTIRLNLKRAADLKDGTRKLVFRLEPNEWFRTRLERRVLFTANRDSIDMLTFSFTLTDVLSAGAFWDGQYAYYFGTFSVKKVTFLNELLGMPLGFWSVSIPSNQYRALAAYYASTASRYLREKAELGEIITDEDGSQMTMGAAF